MGLIVSEEENDEEKLDNDIPEQYLCDLTKKIMSNPMMALTTGKVYEHLAIQKWIESGETVDPTNGIPLCIEKSKDAAFEFREDLRKEINEYLESNPKCKVLQSTKDIDWNELFKDKLEHICWLKSDYKRQEKQMMRQAQILFSSQRITPGKNDDDLKYNNPMDKIDCHDVPLRHDIPIVTFIGPSRYGKSTLLNDILGVKNAFKVSASPNIQCTKGAWIACYKSINGHHITDDEKAPDLVTDDEIISMPISMTKGAMKKDIINKEYDKEIVGQLSSFGYSRKQIITAMDMVDNEKDINEIIDCIDKEEETSQNEEIKNEMDDREYCETGSILNDDIMTAGFNGDIRQFYMIDMEGLSHDITPFTKKLFYGCYAISNVMIWNDKQIGSDIFKKFMNDLSNDMKMITKSERKPCLLYLQRDTDNYLDFGEYDTLDGYIKNDESFKWLRDMNIFGSIHGFQVYRRPNDDEGGFDKDIINKLVEYILNLTYLSSRFVLNAYDMKKQIDSINERNIINLGFELIFANDILRGLLLDDNDNNIRRSQIIQYAEKYKWDKDLIENEFERADNGLLTGLLKQELIDEELRNELIKNKNEVIDRIKEKNTNDIIKIAFIVTSPITIPLAIIVGLASIAVIAPYLAGSAIYDKWIADDQNNLNQQQDEQK